MLFHQQETFQDRRRIMFEQRFVAYFEQVVARQEAFVERAYRGAFREQVRMQVLQQHGVELQYRPLGAVVALHQVFAGAARFGRLDMHLFGQFGLIVEQNAVFAPAGEVVQADAQGLQQVLVARNGGRFLRGDQFCCGELAPGFAEAAGTGDPQYGLQIAQAAGTFLDVRFEVVVGVEKARVALFLFFHLGQVEGAPVQVLGERLAHFNEQRHAAGDVAGFQQIGLHGHVRRFGHAVAYGAHTVTDLHADVPQLADQILQALLQFFIGLLRQQDEQVDVGFRKEFGAPVTAHRNQCQFRRHGKQLPHHAQMFVDYSGVGVQVARRLVMGGIAFLQLAAGSAQTVPDLRDGLHG